MKTELYIPALISLEDISTLASSVQGKTQNFEVPGAGSSLMRKVEYFGESLKLSWLIYFSNS